MGAVCAEGVEPVLLHQRGEVHPVRCPGARLTVTDWLTPTADGYTSGRGAGPAPEPRERSYSFVSMAFLFCFLLTEHGL